MVEPLKLLLDARLALERLPREILAPGRDRIARLRLELDDALLELVLLKLEPFLRGHDVGDPALDVLQQLELPLVGVVQRLLGFLRAVEQL